LVAALLVAMLFNLHLRAFTGRHFKSPTLWQLTPFASGADRWDRAKPIPWLSLGRQDPKLSLGTAEGGVGHGFYRPAPPESRSNLSKLR
jgi:hypothetical protein